MTLVTASALGRKIRAIIDLTHMAEWRKMPSSHWNHQRLVSLLEMLRFFASDWNHILRELENLTNVLNLDTFKAVVGGNREKLKEPLQRIAGLCDKLGLDFSASYASELLEAIDSSTSLKEEMEVLVGTPKPRIVKTVLDPKEFIREIAILRKRIDDQLNGREFFALERKWVDYFDKPHLFGEHVSNRFRSVIGDVEGAGTCLALGRSTASVFHLMRVMERGLQALGASLNDPNLNPKTNPNWERILGKCDKELQKPYADRCTEWQSDQNFFSNATANLRAVKDAWRNPSLHVERDYDESQALEVFNAVKAFMRHIADKLHE